MAASERGGLLNAPDIYMEKLRRAGRGGQGRHHRVADPEPRRIVAASERDVHDLVVVVLDRPRHEKIIEELRETGARIKLIADGDLSAGITVAVRGTGVHMAIGTGGAPEGVLTAAALKCLGGEILARLVFRHPKEQARAAAMARRPEPLYKTDELASGGNIVFVATGVTRGDLLDGVRFFGG